MSNLDLQAAGNFEVAITNGQNIALCFVPNPNASWDNYKLKGGSNDKQKYLLASLVNFFNTVKLKSASHREVLMEIVFSSRSNRLSGTRSVSTCSSPEIEILNFLDLSGPLSFHMIHAEYMSYRSSKGHVNNFYKSQFKRSSFAGNITSEDEDTLFDSMCGFIKRIRNNMCDKAIKVIDSVNDSLMFNPISSFGDTSPMTTALEILKLPEPAAKFMQYFADIVNRLTVVNGDIPTHTWQFANSNSGEGKVSSISGVLHIGLDKEMCKNVGFSSVLDIPTAKFSFTMELTTNPIFGASEYKIIDGPNLSFFGMTILDSDMIMYFNDEDTNSLVDSILYALGQRLMNAIFSRNSIEAQYKVSSDIIEMAISKRKCKFKEVFVESHKASPLMNSWIRGRFVKPYINAATLCLTSKDTALVVLTDDNKVYVPKLKGMHAACVGDARISGVRLEIPNENRVISVMEIVDVCSI